MPITLLQKEQKEPEYTVDPDKPPPTVNSYGGRGESKGVIGLLSLLKEDLEKEMKVAREEEAAAQAQYEKLRAELTKTLESQKKKTTTLESAHADLLTDISDAQGNKANKEEMLDGAKDELVALKPSCDWVEEMLDGA